MTERASAGRTARLLLRYRRDPSWYRSEARRRDAPPLDFDVVLKLAQGRDVEFGHTSLEGASPEALKDAATSYLLNVCFRRDASPYQTLGVDPDASADAIKERFRMLMLLVHPDRQGPGAPWPPECAAQANRAYALLRHPESRAKFDREEREREERESAWRQAAVAAAAAASKPRGLPAAVRRARTPPPEPVLPEWLTAGVGGFVRSHPAGVAFGALIAASAVVAGVALWETETASLTRGTRASAGPDAAPAPVASAPVPSPAAPVLAAASGAKAREPAPARPATEPATSAPSGTARAEPAAGGRSRDPQASSAAPSAAVRVASAAVRDAPPATTPARAPEPPPAASPSPAVAAPVPPAPPASPPTVPAPAPPLVAAVTPAKAAADGASAVLAAAPAAAPEPSPRAPSTAEIESLFAAFVDAYDHGRADAFASLFDADARANQQQGRAAIRGEVDDVFRRSEWRRMRLMRMNWRRVGDTAHAKGEIAIRVGLHDGREQEQRLAVDMELARRDGRLVITRLDHRPGTP